MPKFAIKVSVAVLVGLLGSGAVYAQSTTSNPSSLPGFGSYDSKSDGPDGSMTNPDTTKKAKRAHSSINDPSYKDTTMGDSMTDTTKSATAAKRRHHQMTVPGGNGIGTAAPNNSGFINH